MRIEDITSGYPRRYSRTNRTSRLPQPTDKGFHNNSTDTEELKEDKEGKNVHLEHIEDEILNGGYAGVQKSIDIMRGLLSMLKGRSKKSTKVTVKWDGAPALITGTDPSDGKFFVGTKGVFAQNPKLNKKPGHIMKNHPDGMRDGEVVDKSGLRDKLGDAYKHLRKLGIKEVLQGDLLFTPDMLEVYEIDGKDYLTFKPNTIMYAVPNDSNLANEIRRAKIGIIFHTMYEGDNLVDMTANFNIDVSGLKGKSADVWVDDAYIKDYSGAATLTDQESKEIAKAINDNVAFANKATSSTFDILNNSPIKEIGTELKAHVNTSVRGGSFQEDPSRFVDDFVERLIDSTDTAVAKLKTGSEGPAGQKRLEYLNTAIEWVQSNKPQLEGIYGLYLRTIAAKNLLVNKLNQIKSMDAFLMHPDGTVEVTAPEGFVAVDHLGNAVKLVDRLTFSSANFAPDKKFG
jgi:hypothetical protein